MAEADKILDDALELEPNERARIASRLLASLDELPATEVRSAWRDEIIRRGRAAMSDEWQGEDWSTVRDRVKPG